MVLERVVMRTKQRGMGIAEVVIATSILTAGVGALLSLQISAVESSADSLRKVEAMQIARDFIDNVSTNPSQMPLYFSQSRTKESISATGSGINCYSNYCTPTQKARWDLTEMHTQANNRGFSLTTEKCKVNTYRECIFVLWGETSAHYGVNEVTHCANTVGGRLIVNPKAKCVFLEAF